MRLLNRAYSVALKILQSVQWKNWLYFLIESKRDGLGGILEDRKSILKER